MTNHCQGYVTQQSPHHAGCCHSLYYDKKNTQLPMQNSQTQGGRGVQKKNAPGGAGLWGSAGIWFLR